MSGEESSIDVDDSERDLETTRVQYDWSSTSPSIAVMETIAAVSDCRQEELDPLYERINPDSLDDIVDPRFTKRADARSTVSFGYGEYHVTVRSDGEVSVASSGSD